LTENTLIKSRTNSVNYTDEIIVPENKHCNTVKKNNQLRAMNN